uniref:Uncharacterized protein n=1 Tax=Tetranychus urticae TaxID=32264 RepID=T1K0W3_TETUR
MDDLVGNLHKAHNEQRLVFKATLPFMFQCEQDRSGKAISMNI